MRLLPPLNAKVGAWEDASEDGPNDENGIASGGDRSDDVGNDEGHDLESQQGTCAANH